MVTMSYFLINKPNLCRVRFGQMLDGFIKQNKIRNSNPNVSGLVATAFFFFFNLR